jgi:hypothetical protein
MRKSKARKTGFDVAHVDIGDGDAGWVYRSGPAAPVVNASESLTYVAGAPRPSSAPAPQSIDESRRWMETGARVLVFPLACALVAIAAPVLWMAGSRARQ